MQMIKKELCNSFIPPFTIPDLFERRCLHPGISPVIDILDITLVTVLYHRHDLGSVPTAARETCTDDSNYKTKIDRCITFVWTERKTPVPIIAIYFLTGHTY